MSMPRKWVAEVPLVLWSLRTMPNRLTNFTPFFMVYGAEVVLPIELQYGSLRVQVYQPVKAKESRDITITRSCRY
jgi:hypothetical protein